MSAVHAIGLGEIQGVPRIGEILQVRIPVQAPPDETLSADCFHIDGPSSNQSDDIPWLRNAQIRLLTSGDARTLLQVTSGQRISSPVLMLAVRFDCGVTLRREYTLLLNPPAANEPVVSPTTQPAPVAATNNLLRTIDGESISSIALEMFPNDKALQASYTRALRARNADRLMRYKDNDLLPGGIELIQPDPKSLSAAPVAVSSLPTPNANRPAQITASDKHSVDRLSRPAPRRARQPRLVLSSSESGLQMATGLGERAPMSDQERTRLRTELQLIATLDEKITTQMELSEKLRQLEALQTQLQSEVQTLESRIRAQQANLAASDNLAHSPASLPPAHPAAPPSSPGTITFWQRWLMPLLASALVLVLIGMMLALILRYRRWRADRAWGEESLQHLVGASDAEATPLPDNLFEPLTEEDIWPDRPVEEQRGATPASRDELPSVSPSELGPASILHIDEDIEEYDSAVELAEIMMSFGRVQGAAQTLADYIRANPKQAVKPWIKLLEVYKAANMRAEFDALCAQLNKTFNVKPTNWDDFEIALRAPASVEDMPHLRDHLCQLWGKRECQAWLHQLLRDNRQGTRQGFPLAIVDEILMLLGVLECQLGPYKPSDTPSTPANTEISQTVTLVPNFPELETSAQSKVGTSPRHAVGQTGGASIQTDKSQLSVDFELDDEVLTSTLHINLDELQADGGQDLSRTRFEPHRDDDDDA